MNNKLTDSESEDDWFEQDEEEILQKIEKQLQQKDDTKEEYISGPSNSIDSYLREQRINAAAIAPQVNKIKRISIDELRRYAETTPLETFLFAFTSTPIDFFASQVLPNDSEDRVQLYTRILASICSLNLPGFQTELLLRFAANNELLDQLQFLAIKYHRPKVAVSKKGKQILLDMETLFLETFRENLLTVKCKTVLQHVYRLTKIKDTWQRITQFVGFIKALENNFTEIEETYAKNYEQVYPSLEELMLPIKPIDCIPDVGNSIQTYMTRQKFLLKYDFMTSLHSVVQSLRTQSNIPSDGLFVEQVSIIFHEKLENAKRNERVFVDLINKRKENQTQRISPSLHNKLKRLKVGTLLCFTTTRAFDNLIYATFNYTNENILNSGYLSIEILRQFNVGNLCKQKFILFEAPTFFEPYNHVYNCLNRYTHKSDFPFHKYVIGNQLNVKFENLISPAYLREHGEFECSKRLSADSSNLNASQLRAYESALKHEMCLIQGPPGTGKTHLSVKLVHALMEKAKNSPVVLITYTNDSLDKFLLALSEHTQNFVRFGSRSRDARLADATAQELSLPQLSASPSLKRLYYITTEELKQRSNELKHLQDLFDGSDEEYEKIVAAQQRVSFVEKKLNCLKIIFQYYLAREKQLIAMTTTFAAKTQFMFNLLQSKIVVFEEAAEILESHVIACLSAHTQHVVMIGDHMQLQPFTSNYALRRAYSLNISLFERLIQEGLPYTKLNTQYRMRPEIAQLLTPLFYNELINAECVQNYESVREMDSNLYFCAHEQAEFATTDGGSFGNEYEAKQIIKLLAHLCGVGKYVEADIAILTPYAQQVSIIRKHLAHTKVKLGVDRVFTVDSFQGLEANIVLLSLVRSNNKNTIGFLNDKHRICVALSRARLGLYIIGDLDLLTSNSLIWRMIRDNLKEQSAIGNEFPYAKNNSSQMSVTE